MTFSDYLVHLIAQYADPDYLVYQNTNHPPLSLPAELAITGEEHSYYHDGFFLLPYTLLGKLFGFVTPSLTFYFVLFRMMGGGYLALVEMVEKWYYRLLFLLNNLQIMNGQERFAYAFEGYHSKVLLQENHI